MVCGGGCARLAGSERKENEGERKGSLEEEVVMEEEEGDDDDDDDDCDDNISMRLLLLIAFPFTNSLSSVFRLSSSFFSMRILFFTFFRAFSLFSFKCSEARMAAGRAVGGRGGG